MPLWGVSMHACSGPLISVLLPLRGRGFLKEAEEVLGNACGWLENRVPSLPSLG